MKLVLYHHHCQDGFFSAYVTWTQFGNHATYIPITHRPLLTYSPIEALNNILKQTSFTFDDLKHIELYVLDFCFPLDFLQLYITLFKKILIFDHHETSIGFLKNIPKQSKHQNKTIYHLTENCDVIVSLKESAVKMVYKHYYPENEIPWYIELVNNKDLNIKLTKKTNRFYYGISLFKPYKFKIMDLLVKNDFKDILDLGSLVERNRIGLIKDITENQLIPVSCICTMTSKKYIGAIVNNDISNANDLGIYILNVLKKYDFCIIFNIQKDLTVHCGIRSKNTFNSLEIAEKYKGGGHLISAGFCLTINELMNILNDKIIYIQ